MLPAQEFPIVFDGSHTQRRARSVPLSSNRQPIDSNLTEPDPTCPNQTQPVRTRPTCPNQTQPDPT